MNKFNPKKYSEEYTPITLEDTQPDYWKDYNYGKTIEKLKIGREVEGNIGGKIKYGTYTILSTGIVNITGVGFTPNEVHLTGIFSTNGNPVGQGFMTATQQESYDFKNGGTAVAPNTLFALNVSNSLDNLVFRASNNGMLSDGFSLNVTNLTATCYLTYRCYG